MARAAKNTPVPGTSQRARNRLSLAFAVVGLVVAGGASTAVSSPTHHPPAAAAISPGIGMAGANLGQHAEVRTLAGGGQVVHSRVLGSWGKVKFTCFEGDSCFWPVPGGGTVSVALNLGAEKLISMTTTAPDWVTPEGIHRGSSEAALLAAYPGIVEETTCVPPAGGDIVGYVLHGTGSRITIFQLNSHNRVRLITTVLSAIPC